MLFIVFFCSGKVVNLGQEILLDSNCLELNIIYLICLQIFEYEIVYNLWNIDLNCMIEEEIKIFSVELNDLIDL